MGRAHEDVSVPTAEEGGNEARLGRVDGPQLVQVKVSAPLDGAGHKGERRLHEKGRHVRCARYSLRCAGDKLECDLLERGEGRVQDEPGDRSITAGLQDCAHRAHRASPQGYRRHEPRPAQVLDHRGDVIFLVPSKRDELAS